MSKKKINITYDICEEFNGSYSPTCTEETNRRLDISEDNQYDRYLYYVLSFVHDCNMEEKESPFSYDEWVAFGQPETYIPGIKLEDNKYLELTDKDGNTTGYLILDERTAETIAEGIVSGRFKGPTERKESPSPIS